MDGYQESLFSGLDKSKVPSGFLMDLATEVVDVSPYNGSELTDSNYVSIFTHPFLLEAIRTADVTSSHSWGQNPEDSTAVDQIPLLLSLYRYDRIKQTALDDGCISLEDNIVSDAYDENSVWKNPYESDYLVACSPSIYSLSVADVTFSLDLTPYSNVTYSRIDLDADDGLGYRDFSSSGSALVHYSAEGVKELKIRITAGATVLYTHTLIEYAIPSSSSITPLVNNGEEDYDRESFGWQLSDGSVISAEIAISYVDTTKQLRNPFIYVEGFDPIHLRRITHPHDVHGYTDISDHPTMRQYFGSYDFIYVNWNHCEVDIRDNADLLIQILNEINRRKHLTGSSSRNIILGESMGGLIVRYALWKMEQSGQTHECSTYISHDTPHRGAHLPLGYSYAANGILSYIDSDESPFYFIHKLFSKGNPLYFLRRYLNATSAQQMLYNYVSKSNVIDHTKYNQLQTLLSSIGWPQGDPGYNLEKIGLSNGGKVFLSDHLGHNDSYTQIDLTASPSIGLTGSEALYASLAQLLNLPSGAVLERLRQSLFSAFSFLDIHLKIYPDTGDSSTLCSFKFKYVKFHRWLLFPVVTVYRHSFTKDDAGNVPNLDFCEGSIYPTAASLGSIKYLLEFVLGGYIYSSVADRFEFIPSVSSLASSQQPNTTYSTFNDSIDTPFDAYALNENDTTITHINWTLNKFELINNQIEGGSIVGPSVCSTATAQYDLSGFIPSGAAWSTNNASVATINASGLLTAKRNGTVTVILSYDEDGNHFRKRKSVTINAFPPEPTYTIPAFTLRSGVDSLGTYVEAVTDNGESINPPSTSPFSCQWFVKVDDSYMESFLKYHPDQAFRFYLGDRPDDAQDKILVSLRVYGPGSDETLHSIIIPYYKEFSLLQPVFILYNPSGNILYSDGTQMGLLVPTMPLIMQSSQSSIRDYLRNNAYLLIPENGHTYPNVSNQEDKLEFTLFVDPLFNTLFSSQGTWENNPYLLTLQVRALVYEDELIKQITIPIYNIAN